MVTLPMLWLPILIASVIVFIASFVLHTLPFWHLKDYKRLSNEKPVLDAIANEKGGQYTVPFLDWKNMTAEQKDAMQRGPSAVMWVKNPMGFSFGKALTLSFLYYLLVAYFVAYVTSRTRAPGTEYLEVFRVAGTVGFLAFGLRGVSDAIWYGKPWNIVFKEMVDGLIYGLLIAGTLGWLWPR